MTAPLTVPQLQAALERFTYKPGWKFAVYEGRWEGPHMQITATLPDAYAPDATVTVDVHSMLPPIPDEGALWVWLGWRLARIEVHEMREFLRVDGVVLFDPHAPLADRDVS